MIETQRMELTWHEAVDLPKPGDRVTYRRTATSHGTIETGEAIVVMCWCGMEPMITLDNGVSLAPGCGDTWAIQ